MKHRATLTVTRNGTVVLTGHQQLRETYEEAKADAETLAVRYGRSGFSMKHFDSGDWYGLKTDGSTTVDIGIESVR